MKTISWTIGLLLTVSGSAVAANASGKITSIDFKPGKDRSVLIVKYQGSPQFRMLQNDRTSSIVIEGDNLQVPAQLTRVIDAAAKEGPVVQITPYASGNKVKSIAKIVLQLRGKVQAASSELPGQFMLELRKKSIAPESIKVQKVSGPRGYSESDSLVTRAAASEKSLEAAKKLVEVLNLPADEKVYTGSKVTFEANAASVHDVFRLIGEASGLNIITDSSINMKDDFSLRDVPWDQVLDIVVSKNKLKAKVSGNVVYIITQAQYAEEQKLKLEELSAADAMEPVVMAVIPLSFATAEEMKKMVETLLIKREQSSSANVVAPTAQSTAAGGGQAGGSASGGAGQAGASSETKSVQQDFKRGEIQVDARSNSLIVTNTRETIERIRKLVKELDVALPQVLIDAKIIIAIETFSRNMGIQWGGQVQGGGQSGFGLTSNSAAIPNLGELAVSGPSAGLGSVISLGTTSRRALNATLNLAELNGWSKTVASPRVIVNNKKSANISDGQTNTIITPGGNGGTGGTSKVEAKLQLTVTPQVTSSGSVLLENLSVQQDAFVSADSNNVTNKSLNTSVLVDSGSTLVLGGVYQFSKSLTNNGIPLLKDLPFIGSLFRTEGTNEGKSELMVFISPQILDPNNPDMGVTDVPGDAVNGSM